MVKEKHGITFDEIKDAQIQKLECSLEQRNAEMSKMIQELTITKSALEVAEARLQSSAHEKEIMEAKLEMVYLIFGRDAK